MDATARKGFLLPVVTDDIPTPNAVVRDSFRFNSVLSDHSTFYDADEQIAGRWEFQTAFITDKGSGQLFVNNTGAPRVAGDVVMLDLTTDQSIILPTISATAGRVGVVAEAIGAGAVGRVAWSDFIRVKVTGAVTRGQYLQTQAGSVIATGVALATPAAFAIAMSGPDGANTVLACLHVAASLEGGGAITGNIVVSGDVSATTLTGLIATPAQPNITSVGILAAPHMTAPVIDSGGIVVTGNSSIAGNLSGIGTLTAVGINGTIITAAQPNIIIAESQVTSLVADLALKAPLASPTFTGVPLTTTAAPGTNTTQIASTAFVAAGLAALSAGIPPSVGVAGTAGQLLVNGGTAAVNSGTATLSLAANVAISTSLSVPTLAVSNTLTVTAGLTGASANFSALVSAQSLYVATTVQVGASGWAGAGLIRLPNTQALDWRNSAGTSDHSISYNASNRFVLSFDLSPTHHFGAANIGFGTTPTAPYMLDIAGNLRVQNAIYLSYSAGAANALYPSGNTLVLNGGNAGGGVSVVGIMATNRILPATNEYIEFNSSTTGTPWFRVTPTFNGEHALVGDATQSGNGLALSFYTNGLKRVTIANGGTQGGTTTFFYPIAVNAGGNIQNATWWNYQVVETVDNGSRRHIESGQYTFPSAGGGTQTSSTITFGRAFAANPHIVITQQVNGTDADNNSPAYVKNLNTSNFNIVFNSNHTGSNITFNWIAFGPA